MRCPIEKSELERRLQTGESLRAIAKDIGVTYQTLQYHRRRWGCTPMRAARTSGADHASWKGGEFIDRWGYRMIRAPERGRCNPYVPEHVLVAEREIGRFLLNNEVVHHINGDKLDNRPENLLVCTRTIHKKLHAQIEAIAFTMLAEGTIVFRKGKYARIN